MKGWFIVDLIDKRETKFDGTKLSVSLIDMMGLYTGIDDISFNLTQSRNLLLMFFIT